MNFNCIRLWNYKSVNYRRIPTCIWDNSFILTTSKPLDTFFPLIRPSLDLSSVGTFLFRLDPIHFRKCPGFYFITDMKHWIVDSQIKPSALLFKSFKLQILLHCFNKILEWKCIMKKVIFLYPQCYSWCFLFTHLTISTSVSNLPVSLACPVTFSQN